MSDYKEDQPDQDSRPYHKSRPDRDKDKPVYSDSERGPKKYINPNVRFKLSNKSQKPKAKELGDKTMLHPRSQHRGSYDFKVLGETVPALKSFVAPNKYKVDSIDFSNPQAVKLLNQALLQHHYLVKDWKVPAGALCPPIPGRADYIHHLADLIDYTRMDIKGIDIGIGFNCIYPLIGSAEYDWKFVGSEINPEAMASAQNILDSNPQFKDKIELRHQTDPNCMLKGIIQPGEKYDFVMCNPPFHSSAEEARKGSQRKVRNLKVNKNKNNKKPWENVSKKDAPPTLNFGGMEHELWCEGGERKFIQSMVFESKEFAQQVEWFTALVSKEESIPPIYAYLRKAGVKYARTIDMGQGNKKTRFVAWKF
tara:strand:- start:134 stop:1231 length:1098 start_codon:yes stop_codon:yes gene_type:complete